VKERSLEVQLLSVEDVAALMGVSARTVRRLVKSGALVAHRITNRIVRIDRSSVELLLQATRVVGADEDSCPRSEGITSSVGHLTCSVDGERFETGPGTSTAARSVLARRTPTKLSADSTDWPANAAELRLALRDPPSTARARRSRAS